MCGIEKWFVLHFCTNHFVHRNLTKYFSKKLKFFRVAHSKLGAKALSFSSSPHRTGKRWEDIFFSCSQKWTRKNPETVAASGFSGAISFLVAQCGCGRRTRTSDLRVMSPTSCQLLYPAILVPETGVEPARDFSHGILSPGRLPIPPLRHGWLSGLFPDGFLILPHSPPIVKKFFHSGGKEFFAWMHKKRHISRPVPHILICKSLLPIRTALTAEFSFQEV